MIFIVNRRLKNILVKISVLSLVLFIAQVPLTYATLFWDQEKSSDNNLTATNLNIELTSDDDNFDPDDDLYPGDSSERTFYVSNVGELPFLYGLKYENNSSSEVCSEVQLQVLYKWEEGGDSEEKEVYNDGLADFNILSDDLDVLFDHMYLSPGDGPHEYYFKTWLPVNADSDLADDTCEFDITAYAWQEEFDPYEAFWDEEFLTNEVETADWEELLACEVGTEIFIIGDIEGDQEDNPVDELNWPGQFGEFPDFADPFVVGTNDDSEFPWNSNYDQGEATDFDVEFFYPGEDALVKLTISWSPGRSGIEQKEVFLDGNSVGETPERTGSSVSGWWEEMERYEDEFTFPLENGAHTLNLKHLKGEGTLWDYMKLEIVGCGANERDIVINEIMWGGSSAHELDEWIELRNTTDSDIDLVGWTVQGIGPSFHPIALEGTIPASGFYLITHYQTDHDQGNEKAAINDDIEENLVDQLFHLSDNGEQLILLSPTEQEIDKTPPIGRGQERGWAEGEAGSFGQNNDNLWRSMERNDDPGDGTDPDNWHTCTADECNDDTYWDVDNGDDYGTPKAENRSEEETPEE